MTESQHWQSRPEAGTSGGLRFLFWVARTLGRKPLHWMLLPVACYFFAVRSPERRASRSYLNRVLGRRATWLDVVRHFHTFAKVSADRFYFLVGRDTDIPVRFVLDDRMLDVLARKEVGIFLAAHLGSFEAARVLGPEHGKIDLHIVLDMGINERFMSMMRQADPAAYAMVIDSEQGAVALGLAISDALKKGSWVGFLADRHRPGDRVTQAEFFGTQADFPTGPYLIANTFKAPIICAFCRVLPDAYEVHCEVLAERVDLPRKERQEGTAQLVQRYAERLQHHVQASPYGWFNFFDFWQRP